MVLFCWLCNRDNFDIYEVNVCMYNRGDVNSQVVVIYNSYEYWFYTINDDLIYFEIIFIVKFEQLYMINSLRVYFWKIYGYQVRKGFYFFGI